MILVSLKLSALILASAIAFFLIVIVLSPSSILYRGARDQLTIRKGHLDIWSAHRSVEWRPCNWWLRGIQTASPTETNGFIRVNCYGGLNQLRRDLCDGVGIASMLNATLVIPKFEVASYWNDSVDFSDIFDVDYFIAELSGFIEVIRDLPPELESRTDPFRVDCRKTGGRFDYIETVLPLLREHRYISITPTASQRRDRYPSRAKVSLCQACYRALRFTDALEKKGSEVLDSIPKPFMSLHLRFEPDMVAYSRCNYSGLSPPSLASIERLRGESGREIKRGEDGRLWRLRGKCPLRPSETSAVLLSLGIPNDTVIYLASGDDVMEIEGLTSVYTNVITKSSLPGSDGARGNTKAAIDFYVSVNSDAYVATHFGNMDKMVSAMRVLRGSYRTLILNRRTFAELTSRGLEGDDLRRRLWRAHRDEFISGIGLALPYCFCKFKL